MAYSHRDHRARRELRGLYLGFGAWVAVLSGFAIVIPNDTIRLLAVFGLAGTGAGYVLAVDRLAERYQRDLATVRAGDPISGAVRAEVSHEVGFERDRDDDWTPSPHHRTPSIGPDDPRKSRRRSEPPTRAAGRSDPPSDGS
ncbi:MAG: hypothetical protein L3K14_05460 [Thermoplasmata archaeon]|nr:hypothetical protein [Thermoplasmata archaeon]